MVEGVEWLLDCKPRAVQLEALRRSFYGVRLRDNLDGPAQLEKIRDDPFQWGWGHYLEMRLGKTPTLLNEFELFRKYMGFKKLVVLSPNSYKYDWVNEVPKFGLTLPALAFEAGDYKNIEKWIEEEGKDEFVLVVNYEALQQSKTQAILKKVIDGKTLYAADESIKIKNWESSFCKFAQMLSENAGAARELTGLPMTQGPQDLFGQLRMLRALPGRNYFSFRNRYCKMGGFKMKKVVGGQNLEELTELVGKYAFTAKRREWGTPTVPEQYTISLRLPPELQKHYRAIDQDFITMLDDGHEIAVEQVVSKLMKLQQISSGFIYDENKQAIDLMELTKTPKMERLLSMLEDEIPGKVVVAFHYAKSGDALFEALAFYNPCVIRGKSWMVANGRDVVEEKRRFNKDKNSRVMLVNIQAAKYGHDLSGIDGDRTTHMMFYENTYSLDDRSQVEMRIASGDGQDWQNIYMDFAASKVERAAMEALLRKESLVNAVFGAYAPDKTRDNTTYDFT